MISTITQDRVYQFAGLSTDTKPILWGDIPICNGSRFKEIDTGDTYIFNGASNNWVLQPGGGADLPETTNLLKGDGAGGASAATPGTDYATPEQVNAKYTKPSTGIPASDLASGVQTSLGKADTALQTHQSLKTINGEQITGEGNIVVSGSGSEDVGYLENDVLYLKSDMYKVTTHTLVSQADGQFLKTNGYTGSSSGTSISKAIPITGVKYISIEYDWTTSSSIGCVVWFESVDTTTPADALIGYVLHNNYHKQTLIVVPSGANYVRFSYPINTTCTIKTYKPKMAQIDDEVVSTDSTWSSEQISNKIALDVAEDVVYEQGSISNATGDNYADNTKVRPQGYIKVDVGYKVYVKSGFVCKIAKYNSDKTFTGMVRTTYTAETYTADFNGYIRVAVGNEDGTAITTIGNKYISVINKAIIKDLDNRVTVLENNSNTVVDTVNKLNKNSKLFYTEDLSGMYIVADYSTLDVDSTLYGDNTHFKSSAVHSMLSAFCSTTNGWLTQHLMGNDDHGNNMYYYKTHPEILKHGSSREEVAPIYPAVDGEQINPRIIITSNIHYREQNGNFAVYNLLKSAFDNDDNNDFLEFLYKNVEIIWIPCCCPTTDATSSNPGYANIDGVDINRSFPDTVSGTCVSKEATLIKQVIDAFHEHTVAHFDVHTFGGNINYATWVFTNDEKLGIRGARVGGDVIHKYHKKYSTETEFTKHGGSFVNHDGTSSNYSQKAYGISGCTIEAKGDYEKLNVAFLHDIVLNTIIAMLKQ